jgi:hypothetical protein
MAPDPHDITVATEALRTEVDMWSAQAHTSSTAANTPSPTACTGPPGVASTKLTPAELTSDATYASRC